MTARSSIVGAMEGIPQLLEVMTRLTILLDSLARGVFALLDPLPSGPTDAYGNHDFLYPFGKEVALGFTDSTAKCTPILFLARDRVIVEHFNPVVNGSDAHPVELTRVLHVPQLHNNLLSCLYLTKRKRIIMEVDARKIRFKRDGTTLFTATVTPHHTGIVDASTELNPESAHAASTLPMDINLGSVAARTTVHATITILIRGDLVIGLVVSSKSQPDPICEACLAGKMTSGAFSSSDSISEHPLELVRSDLHGPLPIATAEGFMCGIGSLLRPYQVQLPIPSGSSGKPDISHFGCLGALPTSISSEISENLCSLTWRSASLWAIHLVTRAGSSIIFRTATLSATHPARSLMGGGI